MPISDLFRGDDDGSREDVVSYSKGDYDKEAAFTFVHDASPRFRMHSFAMTFVVFACFALSVDAQEWTRFRGPNGSGVSDATGLPATWTDEDVAFKIELPGVGHSSPVVCGEKLFVMSADPESATRYVLCLNADTGKELWRREYPSEVHSIHLRSSFASCTPAVDDERVYLAWGSPQKTTFLAVTHNGEAVWKLDFGPFVSQHGFGTSPLLYRDLAILANVQQHETAAEKPGEADQPGEAYIVAVDRATGELRWKTPKHQEVVTYAVPCIYTNPAGVDELISCASGRDIFSLDPLTGKENWSIDVFDKRVVSSPVIAGGLIFGSTGSGGGGNYVVAVKPGPKPELAFEVKTQAPYVPTLVAHGDLAFLWADNGIVTCIEAATGKKYWTERIGSNFSGSPVCADGKLYCIDEQGVVFVLAAGREFALLGKNPLGEPSRATPSIARGKIYLRSDSQLVAVGKKDAN